MVGGRANMMIKEVIIGGAINLRKLAVSLKMSFTGLAQSGHQIRELGDRFR